MQCSQPGSNASLPPLTFLHISDPSEAKLPSHRKAVHSHAALFQASQDRAGREPHAKRKEPRKRKRKNDWSGEPLILELGLYQNSQLERPGLIFPAEFWSQEAYQCFSPSVPLLGAGRVDPFRTYPIPWAPDIPQLVDHYIVNMATHLPVLDEPEKPGLLRTRWFPMVMTEAATFYVIMLLAASHLALVRNSEGDGPTILRMKSKAIASVRSALIEDGPSDQLIGAVVKMASYEAMFGEQESFQLHMAGLLKMVEMRGGLSSLGLNGMLAKMCVWIDRNSAALLDTAVHFTSVPEDFDVEVNLSDFLVMR
ncbi:hypothetical protein L207DRAFT_497022 [Hyaloscypha variabilis F]|uniref:Transcription factor domain-containing protein n=1 Tax=Hyaloscypha variabilis (strain UAMH 11265 / GT02V1 / F) TaxID=1149755 RepID=A0A2J6R925_HYAVF|nr:hypothetical protein L207DRAFT_497022 [Hyaloscypha variabilis F]